MLVCLRQGLSLLRQHPPHSLLPLPPRPSRLLLLFSLHFSAAAAAAAMGENSAAGKDSKGKAPAPPPTVVPDEAYLEAVTQKRIHLFEEIQARQALERLNIGGEPIKIILPDGAVKDGKKWISTPMDIAKEISSGLAASCLIAQVNGKLWDMARPLEARARVSGGCGWRVRLSGEDGRLQELARSFTRETLLPRSFQMDQSTRI